MTSRDNPETSSVLKIPSQLQFAPRRPPLGPGREVPLLNGVEPFEYLIELLKHSEEVRQELAPLRAR